jgi:hypothetical protein
MSMHAVAGGDGNALRVLLRRLEAKAFVRRLFDSDFKSCRRAAWDGIPLQPQSAERRDISHQMRIDHRRLPANCRNRVPHLTADLIGERLLPIPRDGESDDSRVISFGFTVRERDDPGDNAFVRIGDWPHAQALADSLSPDDLHRIFDRYAELCCPVLDAFPYRYHWSLMQVEYATDLVFRSAGAATWRTPASM